MPSSGITTDFAFKRVDRLRNELRDLRKRWDNRLILESADWPEAYLDGRLEIILEGEWPIAGPNIHWAARIVPAIEVAHGYAPALVERDAHVHCGDCGDEQVMLVVIVEIVEPPKRFVRSVLRPYLIKNETLSSGKGLLYRLENRGGYKVFPRWVDGEVLFGGRINGPDNTGAQMVEGGSEVVGRIPYDQCERFRDWLRGSVDQAEGGGFVMGPGPHIRLYRDRVEVVREGFREGNQLINVAVGPLNL